jgi:hypothetical protein
MGLVSDDALGVTVKFKSSGMISLLIGMAV